MSHWYCRISGREAGPFTTHQVRMLYRDGRITLDTLIRPASATRWQPASSILGGRSSVPPAPAGAGETLAVRDKAVPIGYVMAGIVGIVCVLLLFLLLFFGCLAGRLSLVSGEGSGDGRGVGDGTGSEGIAASSDSFGEDLNANSDSDGGNGDAPPPAHEDSGAGTVTDAGTVTSDDAPTGNFVINPLGTTSETPAESSATGASGTGGTGGVGAVGGTGGGGGGGGTGGMSEFFGSKARGNRFVYIIDQSGSMSGSRFERACNELLKAVDNLHSRQQFYVYFFTDQTRTMFDNVTGPAQLQRATPRNTDRLEEWVRSLYASGGNGAEAQTISAALELEPDAIYFLSDGGFDVNTGDIVRENNSRPPVPINTIGFGDRSYEELLKQIAEESGGTYTFVP